LIDEFRKRCRFKELVKRIKKLAARYVGAPIFIEDKANGPALLDHLSES
jgi:phage terminase large subunit-like protein